MDKLVIRGKQIMRVKQSLRGKAHVLDDFEYSCASRDFYLCQHMRATIAQTRNRVVTKIERQGIHLL